MAGRKLPASPAGRPHRAGPGGGHPDEARNQMLNDIGRKTDLQNAQPIGADSRFPHVHAERSGALGKYHEISVPPSVEPDYEERLSAARLRRWDLLAGAVTLLSGQSKRISVCHKCLVPDRAQPQQRSEGSVTVMKSKSGATFYAGLMSCGSVWSCPICAAKISERRRVELKQAIAAWTSTGGRVFLLTQTFPHGPHDRLDDLYRKFEKARYTFFNRKTWRTWTEDVGLRGHIRSLEITRGPNGWHVHMHVLLFVERGPQKKEPVAEDLLKSWQSAFVSAGLGEPNKHGLDLQDGSAASDYVGKWGLDLELTKGHLKKGRGEGKTPWDLLADFVETGDCDSGELFKEFCRVFKGKKQLHWSRGLRKLLGLGAEKTDKELAESLEDEAVVIGSLSRYEWGVILKKRATGIVLELGRYWGWSAIRAFVDSLRSALLVPVSRPDT